MLCLACYGDRLASVLENATDFLLYERNEGHISPAGRVSLPSKDPTDRTSAIVACGVTYLLCGAICRATQARLQGSGVAVEAWLRGGVDEVLEALRQNDLDSLAMPGCAGRGGCGPGPGFGSGFGPGPGAGPGNGQGRGGGKGSGRGMGRRSGSGNPGPGRSGPGRSGPGRSGSGRSGPGRSGSGRV